jgi:hypothetical protein
MICEKTPYIGKRGIIYNGCLPRSRRALKFILIEAVPKRALRLRTTSGLVLEQALLICIFSNSSISVKYPPIKEAGNVSGEIDLLSVDVAAMTGGFGT